jgi:hypothetical protein
MPWLLAMNSIELVNPLSAFTRVGHALFERDGVKLAFGRRWDGVVIHVSQAQRGLACGCYCPAKNCGRKLIAKKPESDIAHHFAHAPLTAAERAAGIPTKCAHGQMTAIHAYAEQLLAEKKELILPRVEVNHNGQTHVIREARLFAFDTAQLEAMDGETIPDVIVAKGAERMHVEIYVTHRCGLEKRAKIIAANISVVEIDLSGFSCDGSIAGLDDAILKSSPREWIHNRKAKAALERLEQQAQDEAARAKRERLRAIGEISRGYSTAIKRNSASAWGSHPEVVQVDEVGDTGLLDIRCQGEGYFAVHPKRWKARVLNLLRESFSNYDADTLVDELARQGWVTARFEELLRKDPALLGEAGLPEGGASAAVADFLQALEQRGVAQYDGWKWSYTVQHSNTLIRRKRERDRIAQEEAARGVRNKRLSNLVTEVLLAAVKDSKDTFQFSSWKSGSINGNGQTVQQIVDEGRQAWVELEKGLVRTLAVLKDESEDSACNYDLPIKISLHAMTAIHDARAAEKKKDEEEAARLASVKRVKMIVEAARMTVGEDEATWIDIPNHSLDGKMPKTAAGESPELFTRAKLLLSQHCEDLAKWQIWIDKLDRRAMEIFQRRDKVDLFMNNIHPGLPGGVSPRAHTKDDKTMTECLALLKPLPKKR